MEIEKLVNLDVLLYACMLRALLGETMKNGKHTITVSFFLSLQHIFL